jgi:hypothetical protein
MVAKNTTTSAVPTPSVLELLKAQLIIAEQSAKGSEAIQAKLESAKAEVTKLTAELTPFAEARNRVTQLKNAIRTLEAPVSGKVFSGRGVEMTPEVKAKLSATHKALWAKKKAAAAAAGQPAPVVGVKA